VSKPKQVREPNNNDVEPEVDSDDDVPLIRLMDVKIIFVDDTSVQMISLRNRLQWL